MSELTQDKVDESHLICHLTHELSFDEVKAQDFVGISEEEHITLTDLPTEVTSTKLQIFFSSGAVLFSISPLHGICRFSFKFVHI